MGEVGIVIFACIIKMYIDDSCLQNKTIVSLVGQASLKKKISSVFYFFALLDLLS